MGTVIKFVRKEEAVDASVCLEVTEGAKKAIQSYQMNDFCLFGAHNTETAGDCNEILCYKGDSAIRIDALEHLLKSLTADNMTFEERERFREKHCQLQQLFKHCCIQMSIWDDCEEDD